MREMRNVFEGWEFYSSTFDEVTGTTVRVLEEPAEKHSSLYHCHPGFENERHYPRRWPGPEATDEERQRFDRNHKRWRKRHPSLEDKWHAKYGYHRSHDAFSPVPEFIDLKITDRCNLGCPNCYQDSTSRGRHAPMSLIDAVLDGLDLAPYQIALGGGEPILHPQLPQILRKIRRHGTVPNYTTSGMVPGGPSVALINATNEYCGGIALSYHPHVGIDKFVRTFLTWKGLLRSGMQINTHVLMDKTGVDALTGIVGAFQETEGLSPADLKLVLLAYCPDLGRASLAGLMPKRDYMNRLPGAVLRAKAAGAQVAFSEGLTAYFLSRPELGMNLSFGTPMEGILSCYVDDKGLVLDSSLTYWDPKWTAKVSNIYKTRFQEIWDKGWYSNNHAGHGDGCSGCRLEPRCVAHHETHLFMCRWQSANDPPPGCEPPLTEEEKEHRAWHAKWKAEDLAKIEGAKA